MSSTPKHFLDVLDFITQPKAPTAKSMGALEALHAVRTRNIFADRNIVGVGVSEKVVGKKKSGELSVCFYVEKKIPKSKLKAGRLIPTVLASPDGKACFTDVKVVGRIRPQLKVKQKEIQSGYSVGHHDWATGTLGAIVKKTGKYFILSNSHVLALSGTARVGDGIIYPGPDDKGTLAKNRVAKLTRFIKFKTGGTFVNEVDAALAEIDAGRLADLNFEIFGLKGSPRVVVPKRGMKVIKRGRTTGDTTGEVVDVDFRIAFPYPELGVAVGFRNQVLCTRYTKPGDSGSIVVDQATGKIVGLHFAGSGDGSVFNPIQAVQSALGFTFTRS